MFSPKAAREFTENKYKQLWPDAITQAIWLYYRIKQLAQDPFMQWVNAHLPPAGRILEVGAGTGELGAALAWQGKNILITDVNISPYGGLQSLRGLEGNLLPPTLTLIAADFHHLPFPPECFEVVICHDALHHATDLEQCVGDLYRVLTKGGKLLAREPLRGCLVPARYALGEYARHPTNENVYTLRKWKKVLSKAGFSEIEVTPQGWFDPWWGGWKTHQPGSRIFSFVTAFFACSKPRKRHLLIRNAPPRV